MRFKRKVLKELLLIPVVRFRGDAFAPCFLVLLPMIDHAHNSSFKFIARRLAKLISVIAVHVCGTP